MSVNFNFLPKFTNKGNYTVTQPISRHFVKHMEEWINDDKLQMNPDFQRGHVWTEDQQISFMEYLIKGGQSGKDIFFNQAGWMTDWKGDFVLVDGLQRLTAVIRFLKNEIPVFGNVFFKDIENWNSTSIVLNFHVNNLKTKKEVLQWYIEMNSGGTVHSIEEIERVKSMIEQEI